MEQSQQQPSTVQFAMNYGAVLGLYYIGKFMLFPLSFKSPLAGLLFVVLTLAVPVLAYKLTKRFRYSFTSDGDITFSKAWSFALQLFLYASVIVAAAHYIYFTFFDHGTIAAAFNDSLAQMQTTTIEGVTDTASWRAQLDSMKETFKTIASMTPAQITMQLLGNNLFWGCIAALPVAVLNAHRPALMK